MLFILFKIYLSVCVFKGVYFVWISLNFIIVLKKNIDMFYLVLVYLVGFLCNFFWYFLNIDFVFIILKFDDFFVILID